MMHVLSQWFLKIMWLCMVWIFKKNTRTVTWRWFLCNKISLLFSKLIVRRLMHIIGYLSVNLPREVTRLLPYCGYNICAVVEYAYLQDQLWPLKLFKCPLPPPPPKKNQAGPHNNTHEKNQREYPVTPTVR